MVIAEQGVEVGDEVFAVEMHQVVIEVDRRKGLNVGVHVQLDVCQGRFVEQLHHERVVLEVCSALEHIVKCQRISMYPFIY